MGRATAPYRMEKRMNEIRINGKTYRFCDSTTIRQDRAIDDVRLRSGLTGIEIAEDETESQAISRIYNAMVDTGTWAELLACRLLVSGASKWDESMVASFIAELESVTNANEKADIQKALIREIAHFFIIGLTSRAASRVYSRQMCEAKKEAALRMMARSSGLGWFARLLATTRRAWMRFSTAIYPSRAHATSNG